jgi:hypothetical protein
VTRSTFQIDANEWRALFLENLQRTVNFVSQNPALKPESLRALHLHLDRSKTIAAAWCAAGLAAVTHAPQPQAAPSEPLRVEVIGAPPPTISEAAPEAPKRKGGWPKGKPRIGQKRWMTDPDRQVVDRR